MSETDSFEQALDYETPIMAARCFLHHSKDGDCKPCATYMADRLRRAHEREIRDVSQREFARGMDAGQHSMDAEHRAVAMRLRGLRFDGGSHENLARIAYAIYPCATGWMCESADGLRDRLIDLLGGVSDDTCGAGCCCAAADCDGDCGLQREEVTNGRVADDCGADTGCGDGGGDLHMAGVTDELREWMSTVLTSDDHAWAIADRIDEQFARVCQQQEAVLQKTIDGMVKEYEHDRESDQLRIEKLEKQRDHWHQQTTDMMNHADAMEHERDAAYARTDELSDELLRVRRERDELREKCAEVTAELAHQSRRTERACGAVYSAERERERLQAKLDEVRNVIDG